MVTRENEWEYEVRCSVCGWRGVTLLRGYCEGCYFLECEECGARVLFPMPPPRNRVIVIGESVLDRAKFAAAIAIAALLYAGEWLVKTRMGNAILAGAATFALLFTVVSMFFGNLEAALAGVLGGASAVAVAMSRE